MTLWTMSQRSGSLSYLTFSTGFSLAIYELFVVACDGWGLQSKVFDVFGRNALAAYILHTIVAGAVKPYSAPRRPGLVRRGGIRGLFWNQLCFY